MTSNSPFLARIALGIVAAMALSIPLAITLHDEHELSLLEKTAQAANAKVTKKNCKNHGKVTYSYTVNAHVYTGAGWIPGRPCDDIKVGESIDITYSDQKPQLSRSDSLESWRGDIAGSLFALALIGVAAAIVIFRVTRVDVGD